MPDAQNPEEKAPTTGTETPVNTGAPATPDPAPSGDSSAESTPPAKAAKKSPVTKTARKAPAKKTAKKSTSSQELESGAAVAEAKPKKKAAAKAPAKPTNADVPEALFQTPETVPQEKPAKKSTTRKRVAKKVAAPSSDESVEPETASSAEPAEASSKPAKKAARQPGRKKAPAAGADETADSAEPAEAIDTAGHEDNAEEIGENTGTKSSKRSGRKSSEESTENSAEKPPDMSGGEPAGESDGEGADHDDGADGEGSARRRPRRRGGRRRRGRAGNGDHADHGEGSGGDDKDHEDKNSGGDAGSEDAHDDSGEGGSRRRRQRQRKPRNIEDEITSVQGSTRLEAKKQRRREGREAGRRRAPIVSEAEFLARREAVDRVMIIRQREDLTQIGVLEDNVLVEHYVSRQSQTSLIGNVYLGRVQNVLPSMEAAFVDIGKGRNAVIYAGEVNWSALGHKDGQPRKIESVLSSGQTILVQVTKDPIGHKGARLSGQVSLPGRFLVYVPDGNTSGISRKLPDTERHRLKTLLKQIVPDSAGVIVRTAAEGASEEELTQDVERLTARWNDIEAKVRIGRSPELLYGEPDLTLKVVRDLFTEDFTKLVVQGDDAWDLVEGYVSHVAPDLKERLERFEPDESGKDLFAAYRVDEQIAKGLDRKVWLPSGGSLIIDRTEAMTVVDVNTGKFTGSGGNLEETVTKNNLEAAEEVVRQLRLRDIGGIIVIDFIDMVLESNRDLVLRRLVECLGRDRTRHQVAEVTSLGLVQMTRKRIGTGLVESFSEDCTHCNGRGVVIHDHPIEPGHEAADDEPRRGRGRGSSHGGGGTGGGRGRGRGGSGSSDRNDSSVAAPKPPSPADLAGTKPKPAEGDEAQVGPAPSDPTPEIAAQESPAQETPAEPTPKVDDTAAVIAPPAAPTVVSTTRRRRTATRPAGPPTRAASVSTESPAEQDSIPATDAESDDDAANVLHVPVKRKGTRKR